MAGVDEPLDKFPVDLEALRLKVGSIVPVKGQPLESLEDGIRAGLGRPLGIRIFDPQHESSPGLTSVEPVEQCRAGTADVKIAGRTGRKTGDNLVLGLYFHSLILVFAQV